MRTADVKNTYEQARAAERQGNSRYEAASCFDAGKHWQPTKSADGS